MKHKRFSLLNPAWPVRIKLTGFKLCAVLLLGLGLTGLQAQESVNATGGNASGSGGSVNYSVGQVCCQTHTGTSGSVAEGVQRPYEVSVVTAIEEATGINLSVTAYPNPTTDYLTLEVKNFELSTLTFQLYDMQGKLLQNEKISSNQTSITMRDLAPATYFVKIIQRKKAVHHIKSGQTGAKQFNMVKTFKVIKN